MTALLLWIRTHDESWLFVAMYIGFAVVLGVWLSLFWLVVMVVLHFLFELIRQSRLHDGWPAVASMASWEIRVDVALVLLAFAVALYMDLIMGILGLQSLGRAVASTTRVGARAVAWQRMVRAVVLGFDDLINAIRAIFMRKAGSSGVDGEPGVANAVPIGGEPSGATAGPTDGAQGLDRAPGVGGAPALDAPPGSDGSPTPAAPRPRAPEWGEPWGFWDRFTMALGAACVAAMLLAPPLTDSTWREAAGTILEELRPFPNDG